MMKLFKRKSKIKTVALQALRNFNATNEGYQVRKGEYIYITDDKECHRILFITKDRAEEFINKKIDNEPIVKEIIL